MASGLGFKARGPKLAATTNFRGFRICQWQNLSDPSEDLECGTKLFLKLRPYMASLQILSLGLKMRAVRFVC